MRESRRVVGGDEGVKAGRVKLEETPVGVVDREETGRTSRYVTGTGLVFFGAVAALRLKPADDTECQPASQPASVLVSPCNTSACGATNGIVIVLVHRNGSNRGRSVVWFSFSLNMLSAFRTTFDSCVLRRED